MENKRSTLKLKLINARKEINNPKKGGTDNFKKRKYVTLQDLYDVALPPLLNEGLLLTNRKEYFEDKLILITKIENADNGEFISTFSPCNESLKIQEQGAEMTYLMRYNLGCLLAIRTDYDDDAESIKDNSVSQNISEKQIDLLVSRLERLSIEDHENFLKSLPKEYENFEKIPKNKFNAILKLTEKGDQ